jgi:hypothetical protein
MSTAERSPVRHDQLDRVCELLPRYVGEAITYLLLGYVDYAITRNLLPVRNPGATKGAVAIKNKLWELLLHRSLLWWCCAPSINVDSAAADLWLLPRRLVMNIAAGSTDLYPTTEVDLNNASYLAGRFALAY